MLATDVAPRATTMEDAKVAMMCSAVRDMVHPVLRTGPVHTQA
jgi:hypothetical protein